MHVTVRLLQSKSLGYEIRTRLSEMMVVLERQKLDCVGNMKEAAVLFFSVVSSISFTLSSSPLLPLACIPLPVVVAAIISVILSV